MNTLATGKIVGLPNDEYHACDAVSHSKLEVFRERPSKYYRRYISHEAEKEEKECYDEGSAAHALILEGEAVYAKNYAAMPDGMRRGTKAHDALVAASTGKTLLSFGQDKLAHSLRDSVRKNAVAAAILSDPGFQPEVTWRVRLPSGVYVQCRTDGFIEHITKETAEAISGPIIQAKEGDSLVCDLKTCGTLDEEEQGSFAKAIVNFGYHRQEAWYRMIVSDILGHQLHHFIFIAPEKTEPFETVTAVLPPDAVEIGRNENTESFLALRQCQKSGNWEGVPQSHVVRVDLPEWYKRKAEQRANINSL